MSKESHTELGKTLWALADQLRGSMDADDFRDYMLSFLFFRHLSYNYEIAAQKELGPDYPAEGDKDAPIPLQRWYDANPNDVAQFEQMMRLQVHYVIEPKYLWNSIAQMAKEQHIDLLKTLTEAFEYIETKLYGTTYEGLFSEIKLSSEKLGKNYDERNFKLCLILHKINNVLEKLQLSVDSTHQDPLGDAYEYLIGQFASGSGKKAGEFYTPSQISSILSQIVILDSQNPAAGPKQYIGSLFDFACGSGSLLLNVRNKLHAQDNRAKQGKIGIGKIFGQEKNMTTYNLARMNMLLHGVKDTEFEIYHGDTLSNDWKISLKSDSPSDRKYFDAIVANPPFSYRWEPNEDMVKDVRFSSYGLAPKSAADFAFLLHGFHHLAPEGTMAIILPHGVLFRGGAEERIRKKLLDDDNIDTVIGLPANLFYSTGIPVCILVLKKCKRTDDVLFINASEHYQKGKKQNQMLDDHVVKIVKTYQFRKEEDRYSRRVSHQEIAEKHQYNLNISRYISTAAAETEIDLRAVHTDLAAIQQKINAATKEHNSFLQELGLPLLPLAE